MVKTYLESLVPKDQIAFLKYIWILKLGSLSCSCQYKEHIHIPTICGLLLVRSISSWPLRGRAQHISAWGEVMELLLFSRHPWFVHSERHKSGSVDIQRRRPWKWVPWWLSDCQPFPHIHPAAEGSQHPGLLILTSPITMETQHCQGNFLCDYHSDYKRIE